MPDPAPNCTPQRPLTPKQEAAALALAAGATTVRAARQSGAAIRTIKLWLANVPAFKERIDELRRDMTERAMGVLVRGSACAARTLIELSRTASKEATRVAAARAVLDMHLRVRETVAVEERLRALEEHLKGKT